MNGLQIGDFNQVLFTKDKLPFNDSQLKGAQQLRDCLDKCLSEIPSKGQYFTWTNNRKGDDLTWERLDRGFTNNNWFRNHDKAQLVNLPIFHSDHEAILLSTQKERPFIRRPYKFEALWITHSDCEDIVRKAWSNTILGSSSFILAQKNQNNKK